MNKLLKFLFGKRPDAELLPPVQQLPILHFHGGGLSTDPTDNLIDTPGMETTDWWRKADEVVKAHRKGDVVINVAASDVITTAETARRIAAIVKTHAPTIVEHSQPEKVVREHFERLRDPINGPKIGDKRTTPFVPLPALYSDDDWGGLGVDPSMLAPQFRKP